MNNEARFLEAFEKHIPEHAVNYCWELWKQDPFHFFITKDRASKLGDFRYRKDRKVQTITINHNLNPYQFLLTYIHEVAHYRAFSQYGVRVRPHGMEWKKTFQSLLFPLLNEKIFPREILIPLKRHMVNPKASSGTDLFLSKAMKSFDVNKSSDATLLVDLFPGEEFELHGRKFKKELIRRTRILCQEIKTGKKYLISAHAEVKKIHNRH